MNCRDVAVCLNRHETRSRNAANRAAAEAHLATCRECAGAWLVADLLGRERFSDAPEGLLDSIVGGLDERPQPRPEHGRKPRWIASGGLLAASVVLAWGLTLLVGERAPTSAPVDSAAEAAPPATAGPAGRSAAADFEPGRHYRVVTDARPLGAAPARVEVVQFFMYGCFPCYAFESEVGGWEAKSEFIELIRVPVVFNARARIHAQAHYTAEALGKLDEMHAAFFTEIHVDGNLLDSEAALVALFAGFGVGEDEFERAFRSRQVAARVEDAIALARTFGVEATPSLVVAGRYLTSPAMAGSLNDTFAVVEALVESIRAGEPVEHDRCGLGPSRADCGPGF